jgi:ribosomal protein S27AE
MILDWFRRRASAPPITAQPTVAANETACPRCGTEDALIPVVYGKPSEEGVARAQRGEIALGGCMNPGHESRYCPRCKRKVAVAG